MGESARESGHHYGNVGAYLDQCVAYNVDTEDATSPEPFQGENYEQWDTYSAHGDCDFQERPLNNSAYSNVAPLSLSPCFAENMLFDVFGTGAHANSQFELRDAAQYVPTNTSDQITTTYDQYHLPNPSQGQESLPGIIVSGYDSTLDTIGEFNVAWNESGGFSHSPTFCEQVPLRSPTTAPASLMPQKELFGGVATNTMGGLVNTSPPTELDEVPWFPRRNVTTTPWSHTTVTESSRQPHEFNLNDFPYIQTGTSTGATSAPFIDNDSSSIPGISLARSSDTSWPTNPNTPFVNSGIMSPQPSLSMSKKTKHHDQVKLRRMSKTSQGSSSAECYSGMDIDSTTDDPHINNGLTAADMRRSYSGHPSATASSISFGSRLLAPGDMTQVDGPSSPTPSEISVTPSIVQELLPCHVQGCGAKFRGTYRRSNLGRHLRLVHGRKEYPCGIDGCNKVYRRSDARLKHQRKWHVRAMP